MRIDDGVWLNEPRTWSANADEMTLTTDDRTDFWRETHYGFVHDNGHFLSFRTGCTFTAQVRVRARFEALYDQAGLMVRLDAHRWVKAGVEFSDGRAMLSSVMTDRRSDWATAPYPHDPSDFWVRMSVEDGVLRIQASADGVVWPLVRLAPFPAVSTYLVGPLACTPERAGLEATFSDFRLTALLGKDLHDLG